MSVYKCLECEKKFKTLNGLGCHISNSHKISKEEYYLKYLGEKNNCFNCGSQTRFVDIEKGYKKFCSQQCANKINNPSVVRNSILNRNKERKKEHKEKIQSTWKNKSELERQLHGEKIKQKNDFKEISEKRSVTMSNWSKEEKEIYRQKLKQKWKNKSTEELKQKYLKQKETNIKKGDWLPDEIKNDFEIYKQNVRRETNKHKEKLFKNWNKKDFYTNETLITKEEYKENNPTKHCNSNPHQPTIDHIISIHEGFMKNIDVSIISDIKNLCICSRINNSIKRQEKH